MEVRPGDYGGHVHVAVTGANGFLGQNLIALLTARGHDVLRLVRTPSSPPVPRQETASVVLPGSPRDIGGVLRGIDAIIHLAAAGVSPSTEERDHMEAVNVEGTLTVLRAAWIAEIQHVVIAGTWAEYGRSLDEFCPIPPSAPLRPVSDYAVSKARAFLATCSEIDALDLGVSYIRVFNAFGDHQNPDALWPSLRAAAERGDDFRLTSGDQIRDFIPVGDVAEAFVAELALGTRLGRVTVTNCGTGSGRSVREFAQHWWHALGAEGSLRFGEGPARAWDPPRSVAEIGTRWTVAEGEVPDRLPPYGTG